MDLKTIIYMQSEAEFSRARSRGFWEIKRSLAAGHAAYLLSFDETIKGVKTGPTIQLGLKDIPLRNIVGSLGRAQDFTAGFMPRVHDERGKERWRLIYTLAVSGAGFPPVEVFQVGPAYFVQNGHHRVSVAKYLRWPTIQAFVIIFPPPLIGAADLADPSQRGRGGN